MNHVALVTGASSGIGEEFARQLASRGYDLVLVARRRDRLEQLAADLPTTAHVITSDLASAADLLHEQVQDLGVTVDLLVNNAGFGLYGRFWEIEEGADARQVRVNCEAVITLTRVFLPDMLERGRGGIINIASTSAFQPLPYTATYSASKAFVRSFTDALSAELRGTGVRTLTVNPGPVPTEWSGVSGIDHSRYIPGSIPASQVVAEALAAYDRGRRDVIPGVSTRWMTRLSTAGPRGALLRITERIYRPKGA